MSTSPADPHLPAVHLRPPENWINDPNGLAFHDGHYHVFFQYNPHAPVHARVHWGHYRSPDLVTWEPQPIALTPTPGGYDADGCYSGNAVSDGSRLVAFYSAHRDDRWWQPVTSAESHDGGLTWTKRPDLLIPTPPDGATMYRDPYVWREGDRWRMLVGASVEGDRGAAFLYESADLEHWHHRGPFLTDDDGHAPGTGGWTGWECPQYASFGERGALVVSLWDALGGPRDVRVYVGSESDGTFTPTGHHVLDHGPDFYAPALLPAPDGRWLLWGWSWEARDAAWSDEAGWAGTLTLPREVTLTPDGRVHQQPAREILQLRGPRTVHLPERAAGPEGLDLGEVGPAFDLTARLRPSTREPGGLRLTTAPGEHLDITLDPAAGELVVDRDHASLDPRARPGRYRLPLPEGTDPGSAVDLRVVVDGSIVEVHLATGEALTLRCYPTGTPPWRLRTLGPVHLAVEAWNLVPGSRTAPLEHPAALAAPAH
ncbi:glycoside hydrolase family 32 protein [Kitasatospora phosalacinea]|uniref:glycoside hydrolase family 32 protein n=1 Tax=Kitasatospora phosalacinea TaxID=2065 RepID=UPI000525EF04|nr:glycoside hydrolase family 32 protein [Kitasatospora phosalacinea]